MNSPGRWKPSIQELKYLATKGEKTFFDWRIRGRHAYTGTFQSELKWAGALEETEGESATAKHKPATIPAGEWKSGGKRGPSDVVPGQFACSRSSSGPCVVVSKGNETLGLLRRQGCRRQTISALTVLSDIHMLQVFMHKSVKSVVEFRSQKHGAWILKNKKKMKQRWQQKTSNYSFLLNLCSGSLE